MSDILLGICGMERERGQPEIPCLYGSIEMGVTRTLARSGSCLERWLSGSARFHRLRLTSRHHQTKGRIHIHRLILFPNRSAKYQQSSRGPTFHIVRSTEPNRIVEDIFDPRERVQNLDFSGRDRALEGVISGKSLESQALLHFLRGEEREASVDRVLVCLSN
jgi:hypothetical protein